MKNVITGLVLGAFAFGCASSKSAREAMPASGPASAAASEAAATGESTATAMGEMDIVDTAATAGEFNTLSTALQAAGLVEALKGEGPFTVFAPTDEAFAALPEGTLENLLKPENKEELIKILKYHVVPGKVTAEEAKTSASADTLSGTAVPLDSSTGEVHVGPATVIKPDVMAKNGVIHVIDKVLVPAS